MRKVLPNVQDPRGKFSPSYEGPYVVKKVLTGGALILSQMDGPDLKDPVNSDAVKMYYSQSIKMLPGLKTPSFLVFM